MILITSYMIMFLYVVSTIISNMLQSMQDGLCFKDSIPQSIQIHCTHQILKLLCAQIILHLSITKPPQFFISSFQSSSNLLGNSSTLAAFLSTNRGRSRVRLSVELL